MMFVSILILSSCSARVESETTVPEVLTINLEDYAKSTYVQDKRTGCLYLIRTDFSLVINDINGEQVGCKNSDTSVSDYFNGYKE